MFWFLLVLKDAHVNCYQPSLYTLDFVFTGRVAWLRPCVTNIASNFYDVDVLGNHGFYVDCGLFHSKAPEDELKVGRWGPGESAHIARL